MQNTVPLKATSQWKAYCRQNSPFIGIFQILDEKKKELQKQGIEVIYDDRNVRAGVMFSDADLLGIPVRMIVSPRNLEEGCVEIVARDKSFSEKESLECASKRVKEIVASLMN